VDKAERAQQYADILRAEGFMPTIDDETDVVFKYEGRTYYITCDENDPAFFRLVYPGFWAIESEEERARANAAAFSVTTKMKVAKVWVVRNTTFAAIEAFYLPPESFRPVLMRCLSCLQATGQRFAEEMRNAQAQ
jgi:hypothetical protein